MAHEFERFFEDLRDAVFDVAGEVLGDFVVQVDDADRFGHVADVVGVPDGHFVFFSCVRFSFVVFGKGIRGVKNGDGYGRWEFKVRP